MSSVYDGDYPFGICEVVFNSSKPTNRDVDWDGEKWFFPECGDYGGRAEDNPRLLRYVKLLKAGP